MRTGDQTATKLDWFRVWQIREFAGRDGFGLSRAAQIRALQAMGFDDLSGQHLRDVLTNAVWVDLEYDPDARLPPVPAAERATWTLVLWLSFLLWLRRHAPLVHVPGLTPAYTEQRS